MSERQSYFTADVRIEHEGNSYVLGLSELLGLVDTGAYWLGEGDPNGALAEKTYRYAKKKYRKAGEAPALALAAQALGVDVPRLRELLEWRDRYLDWHG